MKSGIQLHPQSPQSRDNTAQPVVVFISIPRISRSCWASVGDVLGVFPSTTHWYTSCSSSVNGSSYVRRVVDSLYDPSGRVSLMIIVVGKPLTNGVSMQTFTVLESPKTSIEASNLATWSTPDSYATTKPEYWNIALRSSGQSTEGWVLHLPPERRASGRTRREANHALGHSHQLTHGA